LFHTLQFRFSDAYARGDDVPTVLLKREHTQLFDFAHLAAAVEKVVKSRVQTTHVFMWPQRRLVQMQQRQQQQLKELCVL